MNACIETEYTLVRERNLNINYKTAFGIRDIANIIYQHEINVEDKSVLSVTQNYAGTKTKNYTWRLVNLRYIDIPLE